MYINRNTGAGNEGGAIPSSLADGLKEKFASSLVDVETDAGEGDEGDEGEGDEGNGNGDGGAGAGDAGTGGSGGSGDDNEGGDDDDSPITYLAKQYGIDLENDEDFKDLDLTDDSADAIKAFYDKREEKVKKQAVEELFEATPVVKDLIEHLQKGGTIGTWKEEQQVKEFNLSFKEDDIEGKSNFLIEVYKERGLSEKRAKIVIEALKDDNELDSEVEKEVNAIKETKEKEVQARKAKEQEEFVKQQKEIQETVEKVTNIVKKGALINNFVIPEAERKEFNQFILSDNLTNKYEKLTYEQRLFMDYMVFKDFKLKSLEGKAPVATGNNKPRVSLKSNSSSGSSGKKEETLTLADLKKLSEKTRL